MDGERKPIGLAIVGSGTIGRIRGELARQYPGVAWLGLCDLKEDVGRKLSEDTGADYFTTDHRELLALPEVTAAPLVMRVMRTTAPSVGESSTSAPAAPSRFWGARIRSSKA